MRTSVDDGKSREIEEELDALLASMRRSGKNFIVAGLVVMLCGLYLLSLDPYVMGTSVVGDVVMPAGLVLGTGLLVCGGCTSAIGLGAVHLAKLLDLADDK